MRVTSKQYRFVKEILKHWEQKSLISHDQAETLQGDLSVRSFNWRMITKYLFWAGLSCIGLSFIAVMMDNLLLEWLKKIFNLPPFTKSMLLACLAAFTLYIGHWLQAKERFRFITRELMYAPGAFLVAGAIYFLGVALNSGSEHYSALILLAAVVYGLTAIVLSSKLLWSIGLACLAIGFVTEIDYQLKWEREVWNSYLFILVAAYGLLVLGASYGLLMFQRMRRFFVVSQTSSLIIVFCALWFVSTVGIYEPSVLKFSFLGNYWFWLILFSLAGVVSTLLGVALQDSVLRRVGVSFIFINLYTRFFEYGWQGMHKALFFAVLGASFWCLSRYAESIWIREEGK